MRSDVLAAGFAYVLLAIRLIVLSLQGMMSQANFVACAVVAFAVFMFSIDMSGMEST